MSKWAEGGLTASAEYGTMVLNLTAMGECQAITSLLSLDADAVKGAMSYDDE